MKTTKLTAETRIALFEAGLSVFSTYQMPDLRRGRIAQPEDPWIATLHNGPTALQATKMHHGKGTTPDEAVRAALGSRVFLEDAIDKLIAVLRALR